MKDHEHIVLVALAHGAHRARHVSDIRHVKRGALLVCHVGGVLVMWHRGACHVLSLMQVPTLGKENPWLVPTEDHVYESVEPLFLELHAIAMLCLPSGECMCPDATLCATLLSALYSSVSKEVVLNRHLMVSVSISSTDNYCIEVVLRCLATDGDGLGPHELNDGGILATVIAAGFKDAWYSSKDGSPEGPATYIVRGLCRRCCIPEVILRCMQVFVSLVESGNPPESHVELIELVASPETGFLHLFSQQQLQEF